MAELHFSTDKIRAELNGMADLAAEFVDRQHCQKLRDASHSLSAALKSSGVWQIPQQYPLETNSAEREAGTVVGTLSFKWEVKQVSTRTFSVGNASTTIEIHNFDTNFPPISWNTDIGGSHHPGYRLHVQFRFNDKSSEIPRLPAILLTPVDCLDFLLGELFQEKWTRHQYENRHQTAGWTQFVRTRVCNLLHKKAECVAQMSGITPWMTLKIWDLKNPRLTLSDD